MTPLTQQTVGTLAGRMAIPAYDRSKLTVGIVHFGVGGFHRAHQAMYLNRLMNEGKAHDWAICGVGVLPGDVRMRDALTAQGGLYTLVQKHADRTSEARVIGSIIEYLFAPDDPEAVIEKMSDPAVRIVSLTITEGGYNIHPATGEFDAQAPAIRADLRSGAVPATVFGLVTEALRRRRARKLKPFTVMSCDNVPGNGGVARRTLTAFARLVDPDLAAWIEDAVAFPDSMVDRITPVTTDHDRQTLALLSGVEDAWPVVCEPFTQWVLQEHFSAGRPPFEEAGVQIVADVKPYELMKLRLLNADHQALCYFGYLSGYRYVHESVTDPAIAKLLVAYMDIEATPTLPPVPGIDLDAYKRTLIERFSNPEIRDTLARLCAESSDRIPKWLLPVVRERLARGGEVTRAAAVVAAWARYAEGVDESGEPIEIVDRLKERLTAAARRQREHPTAFIENRDLFGDLADDRRFVDPYVRALESLHAKGARATVRQLAGV
ncbi:mannitol dehydrogenase family protein [Nonomuraea sp. LPB2021202275-12-8]|uniref:mannitol dehydrogenase family protein n=1 Tax=Nonomuraea sp. LPB2021202275-12-8 TaxID=3120159 RepID=UPI00300D503A